MGQRMVVAGFLGARNLGPIAGAMAGASLPKVRLGPPRK